MITTANRLNTVQEYYFSKKLKVVRQLIADGKPIINMGIGSPDLLPSPKVIEAIQKAIHDEKAHEYQSYQGLPDLRKGFCNYYKNGFNVGCFFEII